jgi:hypothetical protein
MNSYREVIDEVATAKSRRRAPAVADVPRPAPGRRPAAGSIGGGAPVLMSSQPYEDLMGRNEKCVFKVSYNVLDPERSFEGTPEFVSVVVANDAAEAMNRVRETLPDRLNLPVTSRAAFRSVEFVGVIDVE